MKQAFKSRRLNLAYRLTDILGCNHEVTNKPLHIVDQALRVRSELIGFGNGQIDVSLHPGHESLRTAREGVKARTKHEQASVNFGRIRFCLSREFFQFMK